ncbi:MAG: DUF1064 domain-containing protein [Methanosarcinales archaeon]|nr:DUF1064 domain-containing protein [Methanosarcinales archaeon]
MRLRHKYKAKIAETDGIKFHSQKEDRRYSELKLLQKNGAIIFFLRQVPFDLPGNTRYFLDFMVFYTNGDIVCEDVKGYRTSQYIMKKKLVESQYPIDIIEI